jgi:hypothetical protein
MTAVGRAYARAGGKGGKYILQTAGSALICKRRGDESFGLTLLTSCPTAKSGHSLRRALRHVGDEVTSRFGWHSLRRVLLQIRTLRKDR